MKIRPKTHFNRLPSGSSREINTKIVNIHGANTIALPSQKTIEIVSHSQLGIKIVASAWRTKITTQYHGGRTVKTLAKGKGHVEKKSSLFTFSVCVIPTGPQQHNKTGLRLFRRSEKRNTPSKREGRNSGGSRNSKKTIEKILASRGEERKKMKRDEKATVGSRCDQ